MHVILLALGIVVTAAGGAMIGFGIPNELGVGNTLIVGGITALVGGLILIGLSAVVRQLARLTRALEMRPQRPVSNPAAATHEPAQEAPAATGPELPAELPATRPTAPSTEVGDLSKVLAEPPVDFADQASGRIDPFAPSRPDAQRRDLQRDRGFDSVWPPEQPSKASRGDGPRPAARGQDPGESVPIRPSRGPQAVTILKSGVIEGMAYTLYSDGSIEADLRQGMVRFGSIDELRRHLAEQG